MRLPVLLLALTACTATKELPPGSLPDSGSPSPDAGLHQDAGGLAGALPMFQWVDRAGTLIGRDPFAVDAAGHIWAIDPETAQARPFYSTRIYYASTDCTGVALVYPAPNPRWVFTTSQDTTPRVRPDDLQSAELGTFSDNSSGSCQSSSSTARAIPLAGVVAAGAAPALTLLPPLHQELR
jgi:hypothetical protein